MSGALTFRSLVAASAADVGSPPQAPPLSPPSTLSTSSPDYSGMGAGGRVWPAGLASRGAPVAEAVQSSCNVEVIHCTSSESSEDDRQKEAVGKSSQDGHVAQEVVGRAEAAEARDGAALAEEAEGEGARGARACAWVHRFCYHHRWRLLSLGALLLVVLLLIVFHEQVGRLWGVYSSWLEDNKVKGGFSFVIVTAALTVICFPAAVPTLAAGAIYGMCNGLTAGVAIGTAIIFTGATLGSLVAFLLGRYAFHGWLEHINRRSRWAGALNRALQNNGLKVIVLMRLSPVIPYSVFNYLAALTSVRFSDFAIGSIAIIPGTVLFVFLGAQSALAVDTAIGDDEDGGEGVTTTRIAVTVVGVVIAVAAVLLMGFYAKRELRRFVPNLATLESAETSSPSSGGSPPPELHATDEDADDSELAESETLDDSASHAVEAGQLHVQCILNKDGIKDSNQHSQSSNGSQVVSALVV